jgi:hypothetical protein
VPEENIEGKAVMVLFSLDMEEPWYKRFQWKRFLKVIKSGHPANNKFTIATI